MTETGKKRRELQAELLKEEIFSTRAARCALQRLLDRQDLSPTEILRATEMLLLLGGHRLPEREAADAKLRADLVLSRNMRKKVCRLRSECN